MNLKDLRYVIAIAETGSFSKAAERCFVSQPALSSQVRKLEETLGVKIFDRGSREVVPTEAGAVVVAHARRIVREAELLVNAVKAAGAREGAPVSLGAFPTLAPYLFPRLVPALTERHPELRLTLIEEKTDTLLAMLHEGRLDLALLALPVPLEGLEARSLFSEDFLVCVRGDHPLASAESLHYEDLKGEELLLLDEGHCMRDQALEVCAMRELNFRRDYSATSLETLRQMVVAGGGITLIPRLAIPERDESLRYIPILPSSPDRTIALVWRAHAEDAALYEDKLLPTLRERAAACLAPDAKRLETGFSV